MTGVFAPVLVLTKCVRDKLSLMEEYDPADIEMARARLDELADA